MSGEVNVIPTLRKFRGGPVEAFLGGASLETFSGEGQLKKPPCMNKFSLKTIVEGVQIRTPSRPVSSSIRLRAPCQQPATKLPRQVLDVEV